MLAQYKSKLAVVRIEKQKEKDSLAALQDAQSQIKRLLANNNYASREQIISQLQGIIARQQRKD